MNITIKEKVSYGIGAIGKDMVYAFVAGFLMYYYNTVLGISSTFIGILFMGARIFDAFNDPFMGVVVEKTKTRFGKFRPWIFIGTILNAGVLIAMFSIPESVKGTSLLVYASIAYVLWGVTYTIMDIPYWSMIPSISKSGKDRENITVVARSCAGFGFALPTALTLALVPILGKGEERAGFRILAIGIALFFMVALSITAKNVKEKTQPSQQKSPTIKQMFMALIKNDQALVVVIAIIVFNSSLYLTQNLAIYFFKYDIGNAGLFGVFGTVGGATQILSMLMLPVLRKKFDRSKIFVGAITTTIGGYFFLFLLGALHITNIILLCIAAVIIFIGFGLATVLTTIFLADTVDYGEWKSGQRNESVIFSLQTFVVKLASAISVLFAGIGLDLIHLDIHAVKQTASTLFGMRVLMIVLPIIGLCISIFIFKKKYKLTDHYLNVIIEETKNRRDEA